MIIDFKKAVEQSRCKEIDFKIHSYEQNFTKY